MHFIKKNFRRTEMEEFGSKNPDTEFIKALRKGILLVACKVCGQCHPKNSTHLYDYEGNVMIKICLFMFIFILNVIFL